MSTLRTKIANLEEQQLPEIPLECNFLGRPLDPKEEANWIDVTIVGMALDNYYKVQRHKINGEMRKVSNGKYPPGADLRYL